MLRPFQNRTLRARVRGFSLVELMIAILIALFLLGGLVTLLMGTRRTSSTQTALSQLQDNERIAMTLMTNVVQQAGYFPYPSPNMVPQNTTGQTLGSFLGEANLAGVSLPALQVMSGTYQAAAPGDAIAVRFFAPYNDTAARVVDCAGQSNTAGGGNFEYVNVFQVAVAANGTSWLQCVSRTNNNGTLSSPVLTVNLIPNVTKMVVLYGLSSNAGGDDYSITQYLNAGAVPAIMWPNVTAVKITLTFQVPAYGTTGGQMSTTTTTFTRVIPIMARTGVNT